MTRGYLFIGGKLDGSWRTVDTYDYRYVDPETRRERVYWPMQLTLLSSQHWLMVIDDMSQMEAIARLLAKMGDHLVEKIMVAYRINRQ